jgi:hypothetical protein
MWLMNSLGETDFTVIGMNEWLFPQISEHWPEKRPKRLEEIKVWFNRPGRASTFTPMEGTAHEWITSIDEISTRIDERTGMVRRSLVFSKRLTLELSMNLSISTLFIEVYSYVQYHWWPFTFTVILGFFVSSIRYNVFMEGKAMNSSKTAGRSVQMVSISCPSIMNLLNRFLMITEMMMYMVITVIKIKTIMA